MTSGREIIHIHNIAIEVLLCCSLLKFSNVSPVGLKGTGLKRGASEGFESDNHTSRVALSWKAPR